MPALTYVNRMYLCGLFQLEDRRKLLWFIWTMDTQFQFLNNIAHLKNGDRLLLAGRGALPFPVGLRIQQVLRRMALRTHKREDILTWRATAVGS